VSTRTTKDWEIFITAIMKSIIESGAPKEEWEDKLKTGCTLVMKFVDRATKKKDSND